MSASGSESVPRPSARSDAPSSDGGQTATEINRDQHDRAIQSYQRELRFRAIAQSAAAQALQARGEIDPECAERSVYEIAHDVAVILLQMIYEGDAELMAARAEAAQWRKLAEDAVMLSPSPHFLFQAGRFGGPRP